VVVVIDWLIPPTMRLTFRQSLLWVTYPSVWVVFTLIRGRTENWYPYRSSIRPTAATAELPSLERAAILAAPIEATMRFGSTERP